MKLSGWGRYPTHEVRLHVPRDVEALRHIVLAEPSMIARGNGRAYGDSAVNPACTLSTRYLNHMLVFDPALGQLVVEAGVLLGDIISAFLPSGWFPMVTPGTKFVTIGGAIAADVHGKNHHKHGSFGACVDWVDVMGVDGSITRCSTSENPVLFDHTLGGMGLTGVIVRAAIRLRRVQTAWITQTTHPAANLRAAMDVFERAQEVTYSVAWIDCLAKGDALGRSLVMLGEHAEVDDLPLDKRADPFAFPRKTKRSVPIDFPGFALNTLSVRAFNEFYYWSGARKTGEQFVDWDSYFYPLDAILGWNKIYGRKGFAQFQCVFPICTSEAGLTALLNTISEAGAGSFLAVLKRFGAQASPISFPIEGYTLALDFPVSHKTLRLLETLDKVTIDHGGRFYLAKDSRMASETLYTSDARVSAFRDLRANQGWHDKFRSAQSERLDI